MSTDYYLATDWGGTRVKLGAVTADAAFLQHSVLELPKDSTIDQSVDALVEHIRQTIDAIGHAPKGIALGLTGPVDPDLGVMLLPGKIKGLEKYPIVPRFKEVFGVPVRALNDGTASIYAEKYAGQAKDMDWAVTITIGTGVGSGVMVAGQILNDPRFMFGSQLGHLTISTEDQTLCLTGMRGTGELTCSATALALAVRSGLQRGIPSTLTDQYFADAHSIDFRTVIKHGVEQGDELCIDELRRWTRNVGWLVANAVHAYSPQVVILSGGATLAAKHYLPAVQAHVNQHIFRYPAGEGVPVVVSGISEHAGVLGGAMMIRHHLQ